MVEIPRQLDPAPVLKRKSCFLFGPRQCGKSWLIRRALPDARVFDLLSAETYLRLKRTPSYLRETCVDNRPVVIDEVQKAPELLDEVHRLIEERGIRFLLTGSSARKLRREGTNLLGGRARVRRLHPFSAVELAERFSLERAINHGCIPGLWFSEEPEEDLRDYVGLYLREEIAAESATRNLPAFSRFLEVAALCNAEQVNFQRIAQDAQVPRSTIQEYFSVLKDTLLAETIPAWGRGTHRKTVSKAKFYFFDTGVVRSLQGRSSIVPGTPEFGHYFETWLFHELRCYLDATGLDRPIAYWRTTTGLEVDFILGDDVAIETKGSEVVTPRELHGLKALAEEGSFRHRILVCREPVPRFVDGIEILPWREFLGRLWTGAYD